MFSHETAGGYTPEIDFGPLHTRAWGRLAVVMHGNTLVRSRNEDNDI